MRYPYHLDAFLRDLAKKSPSAVVLTDFESRSLHAGDESGLEPVVPGAVVQVRNAQEAAGVLQAASMHGVSVTPRGGGSGKAGGAIPDENGIVLTLKCEGVGIDIDPINRLAIVDAGVILASLAEAASSFGLRYGPDPA
ncbi:MAG: FAD-binding protein, partial [Sandaracinaceae bacterium]|nr:FAD-binding protein [Sandaracinaceae bacterium]